MTFKLFGDYRMAATKVTEKVTILAKKEATINLYVYVKYLYLCIFSVFNTND